jgi:hypothetical protein
MATLRVPSKLLRQIEQEKGMAFLVSITARTVGEMSRPSSILVDADKLTDEARQLLTQYGCKEVKD